MIGEPIAPGDADVDEHSRLRIEDAEAWQEYGRAVQNGASAADRKRCHEKARNTLERLTVFEVANNLVRGARGAH